MSFKGLRSYTGGCTAEVGVVVASTVAVVVEDSDVNDTTGNTVSAGVAILVPLTIVLLPKSDELAITVGDSEDMIEDAELESEEKRPREEIDAVL